MMSTISVFIWSVFVSTNTTPGRLIPLFFINRNWHCPVPVRSRKKRSYFFVSLSAAYAALTSAFKCQASLAPWAVCVALLEKILAILSARTAQLIATGIEDLKVSDYHYRHVWKIENAMFALRLILFLIINREYPRWSVAIRTFSSMSGWFLGISNMNSNTLHGRRIQIQSHQYPPDIGYPMFYSDIRIQWQCRLVYELMIICF